MKEIKLEMESESGGNPQQPSEVDKEYEAVQQISSRPSNVSQAEEIEAEKNKDTDFMIREDSHLPPGFDPKIIKLCVYVQFFANLFVNVDMGILPAGSIKIKEELGMHNSEFGVLGSVVYFGQTIGSALALGIL